MQKYLLVLFNIVLGLLAVVNLQIANAATPVVYITPKPAWISPCKPYNQRPSARSIENGAYSELVEEQINVETHATYNHFITQIVSESGVQSNSEISVSFNPAYERLDFHDIIIWRNNKPQSRLNINDFKMLADESEFDRFIYNGTYAAKYILSDIRKGDKIEYSYTITGSNPIFNNQFCRSIYFQGYSIIEHQYTTLLISASRKLNLKPFNKTPQAVISNVNGGMKRYAWESFQVPPVRSSNTRQPDWYNEFQRVQVSDYSSWAEVVNWAMKINPLTTSFKGELAAAITKLKSQSGTDKEKYFRNAVELVQDEVRYMGIETGEYSHRANDPEKVFKQRYGDCKDKSLLLASILKAGGIDAYMALVGTGLKEKIDDFLPSSALFNHAVVVATVNGKQIWIDATMAYQRGTGTDIYFPAYRRALILKAGTNALTAIPLSKTGKVICTETYTVANEKDSVKFQVKTKYTLNQADEIRSRLASSSSTETEKSYLDYYSKIYPSIEAKDTIAVIDNEDKNELTTIENYRIGKYMKLDSADGNYHGDFYANTINEQLPKLNGQTKTPVLVNYPFDIDYTVKLIFPAPWSLEEKHSSIVRSDYEFYFNRLIEADTLTMHYRFAYINDYIPANKVSEFMQDVKEISDNNLSFSFYYTPQSKVVKNGTNYGMIAFGIIVLFLFVYLGVKIYQKQTHSLRLAGHDYGRPLGGWLLLVMLGLFATIVKVGIYLVQSTYFKINTWNVYNIGIKSVLFKALLLFEFGGNIFTICYSAFCLVLAFKKRDIFPKYISGFYIYCFVFVTIDSAVAPYFVSTASTQIWSDVLRSLVVIAIWVPYFRMSTRVKETFIAPYPDYNITYEEVDGEVTESDLTTF